MTAQSDILRKYLGTELQRYFFDRIQSKSNWVRQPHALWFMRMLRDLGQITPHSAIEEAGVNNSMDNVLTYSTDDLLENGKLRLAIMLVQEALTTGLEADAFRAAWPQEVADYRDWIESSGVEPAFKYRDNWSESGTYSEITCNFIFANCDDAVHFKLRWL